MSRSSGTMKDYIDGVKEINREMSTIKDYQDAIKEMNNRKWNRDMVKLNVDKEEMGADGDNMVIDDDEKLQPQWKSLETRILMRKTNKVGEAPRGRGKRHGSAWDANNV